MECLIETTSKKLKKKASCQKITESPMWEQDSVANTTYKLNILTLNIMKTQKIKFTGNFGEYFGWSVLLFFATVFTFGLMAPYWTYWNVKYFVSHLEIEA